MAVRNYKFVKEALIIIFSSLIVIKLIFNYGSILKYSDNNKLGYEGVYSRQLQQNVQVSELIEIEIDEKHLKNQSTEGTLVVSREESNSLLENNLYNIPIDIVLIFTNAASNNVLQYHLRRATETLLKSASTPIRLHLITDEEGFTVGSKIIHEVQSRNQLDARQLKLVFVSAVGLSEEVEPIVTVLQGFFTNQRHSYYRDFLFFFSLFLDRLLPGLNNVILMDIDLKVKGDIADLYQYFSKFTDMQIMGLGPELSPVYRHILSLYRSKNLNTQFGSSLNSGGFPGYNSGVVLISIPRLRKSNIIKSYLNQDKLINRTTFYNFHGHLGDQDLYTLIALDHPELFFNLPCQWNRQLCQWWRNRGYQKVFDDYFECAGEIKILHGNCKTEIPEQFS